MVLFLDVSSSGPRAVFRGSPSLAHLIHSAAQSVPHPTDPKRSLWDARDDDGPFTGQNVTGTPSTSALIEPEEGKDGGVDFLKANRLRAEMDEDEFSTGVTLLGSGSDFTVFLERLGVSAFSRSEPFVIYR